MGVHVPLPPPRVRLAVTAGDSASEGSGGGDQGRRSCGRRARGRRRGGSHRAALPGAREHRQFLGRDRRLAITRIALSPDRNQRGHFHSTTACLSALCAAERYDDLLALLETEAFWPHKRWAVRALAAQGRRAEAIRLAEASRSPWASDWDIDRICEEILLSSGLEDDAYARYGLTANRGGTHLATFRAVAKKYPKKSAREILADLVKTTPGDEGKWFAAAKDAGLFEEALALAKRTPCDPRTLTRAARDFADDQPAFALGAGLLALYWLAQGYGYEMTGADVWAAYSTTVNVAERHGQIAEARAEIRRLAASTPVGDNLVARILGRELGSP